MDLICTGRGPADILQVCTHRTLFINLHNLGLSVFFCRARKSHMLYIEQPPTCMADGDIIKDATAPFLADSAPFRDAAFRKRTKLPSGSVYYFIISDYVFIILKFLIGCKKNKNRVFAVLLVVLFSGFFFDQDCNLTVLDNHIWIVRGGFIASPNIVLIRNICLCRNLNYMVVCFQN